MIPLLTKDERIGELSTLLTRSLITENKEKTKQLADEIKRKMPYTETVLLGIEILRGLQDQMPIEVYEHKKHYKIFGYDFNDPHLLQLIKHIQAEDFEFFDYMYKKFQTPVNDQLLIREFYFFIMAYIKIIGSLISVNKNSIQIWAPDWSLSYIYNIDVNSDTLLVLNPVFLDRNVDVRKLMKFDEIMELYDKWNEFLDDFIGAEISNLQNGSIEDLVKYLFGNNIKIDWIHDVSRPVYAINAVIEKMQNEYKDKDLVIKAVQEIINPFDYLTRHVRFLMFDILNIDDLSAYYPKLIGDDLIVKIALSAFRNMMINYLKRELTNSTYADVILIFDDEWYV